MVRPSLSSSGRSLSLDVNIWRPVMPGHPPSTSSLAMSWSDTCQWCQGSRKIRSVAPKVRADGTIGTFRKAKPKI
jgi:hypothetical protein